MTEVKSQDSGKTEKRPVKLPPQQSATDTSNWENRNVSAPTISKITNKRVVRDIEFIRNKSEPMALTENQLKKLKAQDHK